MVGDLVVDGVVDLARTPSGVREERRHGPRKIVILDGAQRQSAFSAERGTPWYSPYRPGTPTFPSCSGDGQSSITIATRAEPLAERLGQRVDRLEHPVLERLVVRSASLHHEGSVSRRRGRTGVRERRGSARH